MPQQVITVLVEYEHAAQVHAIIAEALMKAYTDGLFNGKQVWGPITTRSAL